MQFFQIFKKVGRLAGAALVLAMVCISVCFAANDMVFTDVPADSWYSPAVQTLKSKGIIQGYGDGSFRPHALITEGEFISLVVRAIGIDIGSLETEAARYDDAADFARDMHWISPMHENEPISREDAAKVVIDALCAVPWEQEAITFLDASEFDPDLIPYAENAVALGIFTCDEAFNPTATLTRDEAAVIIARLMDVDRNDLLELYPEGLEAFQISCADERAKYAGTSVNANLAGIPYPILKSFADHKWTLMYSSPGSTYFNDYPHAAGLTNHQHRRITIAVRSGWTDVNGTTLRHEFGHYVYHKEDFRLRNEVEELFLTEADELSDVIGNSYCLTNASEFFADAFDYYMRKGELSDAVPGISKIMAAVGQRWFGG